MAAVYRRRRAAAALLLLACVATLVFVIVPLVRAGLGALAHTAERSPLTSSGVSAQRAPVPVLEARRTYVVQQGDTLWSIARRLQPSGDVRRLVDQLAAAHHGAALIAGDRLTLPTG